MLKHIKIFEKIDETKPFMDTAAIIENCNLIISCDTSIVHLAGSLGKETLLILNYNNNAPVCLPAVLDCRLRNC